MPCALTLAEGSMCCAAVLQLWLSAAQALHRSAAHRLHGRALVGAPAETSIALDHKEEPATLTAYPE
ncbi:hypothetical protein VZT92_007511 [Zoarces viviparus]|uniref:Secreted protein n=1 Tax=Zoarces viviparus TaxID=48416 RepID=A0AAW1FJS6_ZOAVI